MANPLHRTAVPHRALRNRSDWPRLAARTLNAPSGLMLSREADGSVAERPFGDASLIPALRPLAARCMQTVEPHASVGVLCAPICDAAGAVLGALAVCEAGRQYQQPEMALLRELGAGAAAEIAARNALVALRDSEERFRAMFEGAAIGVLVVDMDGRIVQSNSAYRAMVRLDEQQVHGLHFWKLNHPDDNSANLDLFRDLVAGRRSAYRMEKRYLLHDGTVIWVHLATSVIRDGAGKPSFCMAMVENITGRMEMEQRLRHDALHDALTDLPNRTLFAERLAEAASRVDEHGAPRPFAVFFLDLDRFKLVTDSLGHLVGDELLRAVAERLRACVGPADTVARFGGDEFVLLLDGVADAEQAGRRADELQAVLSVPVDLGGYEVFTSASMGIALSADAPGEPQHLLRNADAAMYRARAVAAERYAVFDHTMHNESLRRLQLETDLRQAVRRGEFRLVYQPIVDLGTDRTAGWEVLVRWRHPVRGQVGPVEFIGVAEDTGLIVPLGRWVLHEACRQLAEWQAADPEGEPRFICVNLSARQFMDARLVEEVEAAIRDHGLRPGSLKLELTESTVMRDPASAAGLLRRLRGLGIPIYLDDFGTGYSSLAYLHQLPLDGLKIDRSFVQRSGDMAVVQTVVALARSLGVVVVAEGIEEPAQLEALRAMGCEFGQGYLFAKPMEPEAVAATFRTRVAVLA